MFETSKGNTEWTFLGMTVTKELDDTYAEGEYDMVKFNNPVKSLEFRSISASD